MIRLFPRLRDRYRFSIICMFLAFLLGLVFYCIPTEGKHIWYFASAPPAAAIVAYLGWRVAFRSYIDYEHSQNLAIAGLITFFTHALNFVFMDLAYWLIDRYNLPITSNEYAFYHHWRIEYWHFFIRYMIGIIFAGIPTYVLFAAAVYYVQYTATRIGDEDPLAKKEGEGKW